jgi:dTDP-glucose 4,6-dehydratase
MSNLRNPTNILVTGGAGFIGSAFIRHVLSLPDFKGTIVNLDALTYAGNLQNLTSIEKDPRYIFVHGDIHNEALITHLLRENAIDTLIHFAAESHVDRSILGPKAFLETNVMGTFHLLEAVRALPGVHFHHVSTDEVYGCLGDTGFFTEETPYSPNSPYSASKAASDHLVRAYAATYGISICISNCSNNYGPFHFPEKLIPLIILNCQQRKALPVYGEGKNVRDWLYVEDHAKALYMLLQNGKKGETYNIGGEQEWRNIDIVHLICRLMAKIEGVDESEFSNLIHHVKDRPGHDFRYAIDCSKIKNELGWQPTPSFQDRLEHTIQWYLHNPLWVQNILSGEYKDWEAANYSKR